jgi:hypothetical protein
MRASCFAGLVVTAALGSISGGLAVSASPHPPVRRAASVDRPRRVEARSGPATRATQPRAGLSPAPANGARLRFREETWDFGSAFQGEPVVHDFGFRNDGQSPITITEVRTDCSSCTVAELPKRRYAPGEAGAIDVELATSTYYGMIRKGITVVSDDPRRSQVHLTVVGRIKQEVKLSAVGVYIGKLKTGNQLTRAVTLAGIDVKRFRVLGVESDDPEVRITRISPTGQAGGAGTYTFALRVGPYAVAKRVKARVTIHTDLRHTKDVVLTVYGRTVN